MKYYKLHLIRHGLTQGNLDGRYIGSGTDLPLCAEGRAQLEELKAKFQYPDVPLVFCSPMLRAQQTAEVLFPNAKLTILQDLREMNFGKFENRPSLNWSRTRSLPSGWTPPAAPTLMVPRTAKPSTTAPT